MPKVQTFSLGAFVVGAAFVGGKPAFALGDGTVRLHDDGGIGTVAVHAGAVLCAVNTPGGLITGGDDGRVARIGADGAATLVAERPGKWTDQIAAGPAGAIAFAAGKQATVLFADGRERTFDHNRTVTGLAFAPKGMRLAVAHYNGVTLWWAGTDTPPTRLAWDGAHLGVTFSPDGRFVVTAMQENALHGWRLAGGEDIRMAGYPAKPRSMSWSAKGRYLASSGAASAILWPFHFKEGPQGKQALQLGGRGALVTRVSCHPGEETVAIGYRDGAVATAPMSGEPGHLLRQPDGVAVSALAWDGEGSRLAYGTEQGAAGVIDLTT